MLMILARLGRSESFWAVAKVRSPHTGPEPGYPRLSPSLSSPFAVDSWAHSTWFYLTMMNSFFHQFLHRLP